MRSNDPLDWYFALGDLVNDRIVVRGIFKAPNDADVRAAIDPILLRLHRMPAAFSDFAGYFVRPSPDPCRGAAVMQAALTNRPYSECRGRLARVKVRERGVCLAAIAGRLRTAVRAYQQISAGALEQIDKSFPNHRFTYSLGH